MKPDQVVRAAARADELVTGEQRRRGAKPVLTAAEKIDRRVAAAHRANPHWTANEWARWGC